MSNRIRGVTVPDEIRLAFEQDVYTQYFLKSITKLDDGSGFAIESQADLTKADLCLKNPDGDYVREEISAMWFGFQLAYNTICHANLSPGFVQHKTLSPWILQHDGLGAFRHIVGADPNDLSTRVAFIEKTPRVRIRSMLHTGRSEDFLNWAEGYKGNGPLDASSRFWCDNMLRFLGYVLP